MAIQAGRLVDVADFIDTGWIDCTLGSGIGAVAGHDMQVRRIGEEVYIRGRATSNPATATTIWCTFPSQFWPDRIVEVAHRANADSASAPTRVYITPEGELRSQGTPSNALIQVNQSWIRAE